MQIIPTGDRVMILPDEANKMTPKGLHIPDSATERPQYGTIIRLGEAVFEHERTIKLLNAIAGKLGIPVPNGEEDLVTYKPGMYVMFGRYAGTEIEYNGKKHLFMRTSDIASIIADDDGNPIYNAGDSVQGS